MKERRGTRAKRVREAEALLSERLILRAKAGQRGRALVSQRLDPGLLEPIKPYVPATSTKVEGRHWTCAQGSGTLRKHVGQPAAAAREIAVLKHAVINKQYRTAITIY